MKAIKFINELIETEKSYIELYESSDQKVPSSHVERLKELELAKKELEASYRSNDIKERLLNGELTINKARKELGLNPLPTPEFIKEPRRVDKGKGNGVNRAL